MKVCDFRGSVIKDTVAAALALGSLALEEARWHVMRTLTQPHEKAHVMRN